MLAVLWLAAVAAAGTLPPAPDPADVSEDDDARARELFQNGAALYDEGRYEDAIVAWQEAWRLSGRPLLLFNMANAAERLGRWQEAMDLLSRYRAFAPAEERETLDRRIRNIERRLAEAPPTRTPPPADPEPLPPAARPVPVLPIALFGAGGVGVVTGIVLGVGALDARADADLLCAEANGARWCPAKAAGSLALDERLSLGADIALGVGVAAVAGGVVSLLLPPPAPRSAALDVGFDGERGLVTLRGTLP